VELASRNPARIFGHYPGKGALAAGSDADVIVYDPVGETTINPGDYDNGTGDSVYAGLPLLGRIRAVLLRGRLIVSEGQFLAGEPIGRYLPASALELTTLPR
jgi:dihydropyrimidinase